MENVLLRMIRILTATPQIDRAINMFLKELGEYHYADRAYIIEYDWDKGTLTNTFEWCAPNIESEMELLCDLDIGIVEEWNARFEKQGSFLISSLKSDLDRNSADYKLLEMQGIQQLMAAPLIMKERIVGFVGVDNPKVGLGDPGVLCAVSDFIITELDKRRILKKLNCLSYTDILTGAGNRNSYMRTLETLHYTPDMPLGIIDIDINGLSRINDRYGYKYGDGILKSAASHLSAHACGEVYRTGEDEFVALFKDIDKSVFEDKCRAVRQAFSNEPEYTVSIGTSWWDGSDDFSKQLAKIGERMGTEKAWWYYHDIKYGSGVLKKGSVTTELFREIESGRFCVYLQPQVELLSGRIIGAEALLRKFDESGKMISPAWFVPIYESLGIQMHLDFFVLERVLELLAKMSREKVPPTISVNISRHMLEMPDFANEMVNMLAKHGVRPDYLKLEITEGVSKAGHELLRQVVDDLHRAGIQVSLDDFGTDYSNLSVLTDIGFDEIKIDKSLISDICIREKSRIVTQSVIDMCSRLGNMRIIAEGVETRAQEEKLLQMNCRYGQGYLFYKPMPMEDFVKLISGGGGV